MKADEDRWAASAGDVDHQPGKLTLMGGPVRSLGAMSGVQIEVIASKDFAPTAIDETLDARRLAYQVEKLSLICTYGIEIPL